MSFRMILRQTPSVPEMSQSEGERVEGVPLTVIACVERHREVPFQLSKIQPPNHLQ